jgi:protein-S-isoprenylcysteine O-methyltransferase Ste14
MPAELLKVSALIWTIFGAYWVLSAVVGRKPSAPPARSEPPLYRPLRIALLAFAFILLFWKPGAFGILAARFVPPKNAIVFVGFAVFLTGLGIAVWARIHLGQYWSDKVMLQAGHRLVRTGPYACMRHPIYSGVLFAIAGTAIILGQWRGLLAFLLMLANYSIKARREEEILRAQFGAEFEEHQSRAGFLLPRL